MFMSISLGESNDFNIASLVISWNTARLNGTCYRGVERRSGKELRRDRRSREEKWRNGGGEEK